MDVPHELKPLLSCGLCQRNYELTNPTRLPKQLRCKHSYCFGCLQLRPGSMYLSCPKCGQQTWLPMGRDELPTHEGLVFLLKQLPAWRLGMSMLMRQSNLQLPLSNNLATNAWSGHNWLDDLSVESFLRNGNELCLLHGMPNTTWCHNCQRILCSACANTNVHRDHQMVCQLDLSELLRQLLCNEMDNIKQTVTQVGQLATADISLLRLVYEACFNVQRHIKRQILQHNPTLCRSQMYDCLVHATDQLQRKLGSGQMLISELLQLLNIMQMQHVTCQKQLLDIYVTCRLRASIDERGMQLLNFEQLRSRLWSLHDQPMDLTLARAEAQPSVLLTNYCISGSSGSNISSSSVSNISGNNISGNNISGSSSSGSGGNISGNKISGSSSSSGSSISTSSTTISSLSNNSNWSNPALQFDYNNFNFQIMQQRQPCSTQTAYFNNSLEQPSTSAAAASASAVAVTINPLRCRPIGYPIYYLDMELNQRPAGRVHIEVRNDLAPRLADNFRSLILHERGFGYKGCVVFQTWGNESITTGDFELQNGHGGFAASDDRYFMPEYTGLYAERGFVGMRRGQKCTDSSGFVGSQFRIVLSEMRDFTAIFGYIVDGIDIIDRIARTGDANGCPRVPSFIRNCGEYRRGSH